MELETGWTSLLVGAWLALNKEKKEIMPPIKVFIVTEEGLFSKETGAFLEAVQDITLTGQVNDAWASIQMIHQIQPNVILLDISAFCIRDMKDVIRQMLSASPQIKIIVIHQDSQKSLVLEALRKGALGHLVKDKLHPPEIITTIRAVNRGEVVLSPGMAGAILDEIAREQGKNHDELYGGTP